MGSGAGNRRLWAGSSFSDNLPLLLERFNLTSSGYFGEHGQSPKHDVRVVRCDNPAKTAFEFQSLAGNNPVVIRQIPGKGHTMLMRDGTRITYRRFSYSDGTPVVELKVAGAPGVKSQKIHFVGSKR